MSCWRNRPCAWSLIGAPATGLASGPLRAELVEIARQGGKRGWWQSYQDVMPGHIAPILDFESAREPQLEDRPRHARRRFGRPFEAAQRLLVAPAVEGRERLAERRRSHRAREVEPAIVTHATQDCFLALSRCVRRRVRIQPARIFREAREERGLGIAQV